MTSQHYGGTLSEVHPEREDAIEPAFNRFEAGDDTAADRVLLFLDVEVSVQRANARRVALLPSALSAEMRAGLDVYMPGRDMLSVDVVQRVLAALDDAQRSAIAWAREFEDERYKRRGLDEKVGVLLARVRDTTGYEGNGDDLVAEAELEEARRKADRCNRCSGPLTVKRCLSEYSRHFGGWEIVCKPCHWAPGGADRKEQALAKIADGEVYS